MAPQPRYKLTYFDIRGLGEVPRLILHYAGVDFDDVRLTREQWPAIKPKTPYGQLPVLEVDGVQIAQSGAISRLLAKRYKLAGEDDIEAAIVDSIVDVLKDFMNKASPYIRVQMGMEQGDKEKLFKENYLPALQNLLPLLEKMLARTSSGFFGKNGPTWADFAVANGCLNLRELAPDELAKHPEIGKLCDRVHALPQLAKYLSNRKQTAI